MPLAAVFLGRLPQTDADRALVKALGFVVFLLAFVPLIFGGTVYRMLEKIMTAKLVLVLGYLSVIALAFVSWPVIRDVATGFFRFGTVPLRAQTIVLERHFMLQDEPTRTGRRDPREPGKETAQPTGDVFVTEGTKRRRYDLLRIPRNLVGRWRRAVIELLAQASDTCPAERLLLADPLTRGDPRGSGEIVDHHPGSLCG